MQVCFEIYLNYGSFYSKFTAMNVSLFVYEIGVLEPEELSSIIEGVEKVEKHKLPGIQEEIHRSADSISTLESLESESLTLESLEGDLFEDVRASIQKSSKVSNVVNARSKAGSGVTEIQSNRGKYSFYISTWFRERNTYCSAAFPFVLHALKCLELARYADKIFLLPSSY